MMFTIIKFWVWLRRQNVDRVCVAPGTTIRLFHSYNVYWYAVVHEAAAHNLAMEQMCLFSNINKHSKGLHYEAAFWPLHSKGVSYKVKHESGQRLIYKSITFCDPMESFFSFADSLQTWYHMQDLVHLKTASTMLAKHVCFWGKQNVKASNIGLSSARMQPWAAQLAC